MYDRIQCDDKLKQKREISIETNKKGRLTVYNSIEDEDAVYITSPEAQHLKLNISKEQIAEALSLPEVEFDEKYPIDFNTVKLKMNGNRVLFGGKAKVIIDGEYYA